MIVIGLTGSIASGKSTVAAMLKNANIPVVDADDLARAVTKKNSPLVKQIETIFGSTVVSTDGELDRKKLARIVFDDPEKRKQLEKIVHPAIEELRQKLFSQLENAGEKVVVYSAPLLFEAGLDKICHKTILVTTSQQNTLMRLKNRDGLEKSDALKRIKSQMPDNEKRALADITIENNGSIDDLFSNFRDCFKRITGISLPTQLNQK